MTTTSKKPAAISALRQRMIDDMTARKLQPGTQRGHLRGCKRFAIWLGRAPDEASADDVRAFQLHLAETGLSITTRNQTMTGVKFLFRVTLRRHDLAAEIYHLREPQKVPLVMSSQEVADAWLGTVRCRRHSADRQQLMSTRAMDRAFSAICALSSASVALPTRLNALPSSPCVCSNPARVRSNPHSARGKA